MTDENYKAFIAGGPIGQWLLVKLGAGVLSVAALGEEFIGVAMQAAFAAGDIITVRLRSGAGTCKMSAAGAFNQSAVVYGRAGGQVDDISTGSAFRAGIALQAATAQGDIVEVMLAKGSNFNPIIFALSPIKDVHIRDTAPTTNHDASNLKIGVGYNGAGTIDRSILHFTMSAPPGSIFLPTSLNGTSVIPKGGGVAGKIRRLTQPAWFENQATWDNYATALAWAIAGGDYTAAAELDWLLPTFSGAYSIGGWAPLCQDALDNRGGELHVILMNVDEATDGHSCLFRDSEYSIVEQRPLLVGSYI